MKKLLLILLCLPLIGFGQNVYIPGANFKAYLVGNWLININNDPEIQVSEANSFSGSLDCSSQNIYDLTGIEAFTALTYLDCSNNQITGLNVSNNTALTYLYCQDNQLTSLDSRNGNNQNTWNFGASNNPLLTCINVDDISYSTTNWTDIDT
jgi:Leucine-rich repeat (LRR) protein